MGLDANEWASRRTLVFRPGKRASASVKVSHPCCGITDLNPHLVGQSPDDLKRPSGIDAYPFSSTKAGLFCCTGGCSGFQRLAFGRFDQICGADTAKFAIVEVMQRPQALKSTERTPK